MRNYGKDYKKNGDGYEYVGAWYETSLPAAELKQEAKFFGGKLLAASRLLACGLCVNNIGSPTCWGVFPYAGRILRGMPCDDANCKETLRAGANCLSGAC